MRITKDQADANRERIVDVASRLFRERGFDGVSVADLMTAAGFTHGGFYNHFESKEALSAEALRRAFGRMAEERARARDLADMIAKYLSDMHRKLPGKGCPAAALAGDAARQPGAVRSAFAEGVDGLIRTVEQRLPRRLRGAARRRLAVDLVSRMMGALALARAVPDDDRLGAEVLRSARTACAAALASIARSDSRPLHRPALDSRGPGK